MYPESAIWCATREGNDLADLPKDRSADATLTRIARWGALGAVSGLAATLTIFLPVWTGVLGETGFELGPVALMISPISLGPGLAFGLICGFVLRRERQAVGWRYPGYVLAATASYFAAVNLSTNLLIEIFDHVVAIGVIAGFFGAALLTGLSAALMPCFRNWLPVVATVGAGGILGALLYFPIGDKENNFFAWLALYGPWQAGYAAAMATALRVKS